MRGWLKCWIVPALLVGVCGLVAGQEAQPPDFVGPFVANVTTDSVVVWWQSTEPAAGKVVVDGGPYEDTEAPYEVQVTGLKPDKAYEYHLVMDSGARYPEEGEYTFRTAPEKTSSRKFSFAMLCDSRGTKKEQPVSGDILAALLRDAKARGAELVCFPGDLVFGYQTEEAEYRRQLRVWKAVVSEILHEMPIYATMGNHDVLTHRDQDDFGPYDLDGVMRDGRLVSGEEVFAEEFVNPTNGPRGGETEDAPPYAETCYSLDYGNCHLTFINTNYWVGTRAFPYIPGDPCRLYKRGNPEGRIMDRQLNWVRYDLDQARKRGMTHLFILGHEPAFPVGKHVDDAMYYDGNATLSLKKDVRERRHSLWSMWSDDRVLVAFFGDEHNYSRGLMGPVGKGWYDPPVWQVISGGAGAPLTTEKMPKAGPGEEYVPPETPHPYRRLDMPWSDAIRAFAIDYHYCLVHVEGSKVSLEVWAMPEDFDPTSPDMPEMKLIDQVKDLTVRD